MQNVQQNHHNHVKLLHEFQVHTAENTPETSRPQMHHKKYSAIKKYGGVA